MGQRHRSKLLEDNVIEIPRGSQGGVESYLGRDPIPSSSTPLIPSQYPPKLPLPSSFLDILSAYMFLGLFAYMYLHVEIFSLFAVEGTSLLR